MSRSKRGYSKLSGSPPKKAICCLRGEDQPDVGVLLEAIEVVLPALVERDHVAAQAGLVERLLLDRGDDGAARLRRPRPASCPA